MPGSTRINPPSPRTTMALLKTHSLCRTQNAVSHLIQHGFTLSGIPAFTAAGSPEGKTRLAQPWSSALSQGYRAVSRPA